MDYLFAPKGHRALETCTHVVSAPAYAISEGLAQDYHTPNTRGLGFPEFTRFSLRYYYPRLQVYLTGERSTVELQGIVMY